MLLAMILLVDVGARALAATVTEVPAFLRGDVALGYRYDRTWGGLEEAGDPGTANAWVGSRRIETHQVHYGAAFGVAPGAAIFADVLHDAWWGVSYDAWGSMHYDGATGGGSYSSAAVQLAATKATGAGIEGVWIGAKGTPFSEAFPKRPSRATWLIEGAVRTPNEAASRYVVLEPGAEGQVATRGAGPGGVGLMLGSAFSSDLGRAEPYLSFRLVSEGATTVDLVSDAGQVLAEGVAIDPADTFSARVGAELVLGENSASGARTAIDLHASFEYASYATVPSGLYLPSVLVEGQDAQQAESLEPGLGLQLRLRPFTYLDIALHGDLAYHLPSRAEQYYPVYTGPDTLRLDAGLDLTVRVR